jgi:hypothetical protein
VNGVLAYLKEEHPESYRLAAWARAEVLAAEPWFEERIYRGWRGIGFRHPEAGYVCGLFPEHDEVRIVFEHGASMADPDGRLEGEGTQTRHYSVRDAGEGTRRAIRTLVEQAVAERLLARSAPGRA